MEFSETCYIFGAGEFSGLVTPPGPKDFILAADGGLLHCRAAGLAPHLLLGDFDSLQEALPDDVELLRFPVEKDDTDTMLALKEGVSRGFTQFHLYGGTGGRMDHTLANLQALSWLAERGCRGYLYDSRFVFTAIRDGAITLPAQAEGLFSVFCTGGIAEGVSIRGGFYGAEDAALTDAFPLGVSNHFTGRPVEISVRKGRLLIGWEHN